MFRVHDPKERNIAAAPFRDRVVHHALCAAMEPRLEALQVSDSYACRVGRGTHAALERSVHFARSSRYFLKLDVEQFFLSIDHAVLLEGLARVIKDKAFLGCLGRIIHHSLPGSAAGKGVPIGNLTSQHFANFYLSGLDHYVKEHLCVKKYIRYMDDLLIFYDDTSTLKDWQAACAVFLEEKLQLRLHESVTRLGAVKGGVPFLGMRVFPDNIRLSRACAVRFCKRVRTAERRFAMGEISQSSLVDSMNSLMSWAAHANTLAFRRGLLQEEGSGLGASAPRTG